MLDIIQGEYPVYCKINVPKNNTEKNKEANKILQLKFVIKENNYALCEAIHQHKSIVKSSSEDEYP